MVTSHWGSVGFRGDTLRWMGHGWGDIMLAPMGAARTWGAQWGETCGGQVGHGGGTNRMTPVEVDGTRRTHSNPIRV